MYEPHLLDYASSSHHRTSSSASNGYAAGEGASILEELDKITPANLKAFDAFPKVESTYVSHSQRGGILTALVSSLIFLLVLNDLGEFLYGAPEYRFEVDHGVERELQVNVDLTVAMPCQYLTVDLRDAVGDRLHLSDAFQKEGTTFAIGKASSSALQPTQASPHSIISSASRRTPSQQSSSSSFFGGFFGGITRLLTFGVFGRPNGRGRTQYTAFRPTVPLVEGGEACRLYGSVMVKKANGNLHVTTLGHGYMSWEHTDHTLMNLTHVIHEFSFGPFFPAISQPLDMSYELTEKPFAAFQYFLRVIPTTYISASRQILRTSQYAVTASSRSFEHGKGVPGLFFKYDLDGMSLTVRERTTSLYHFLIRLAGVVGGVWTVASFGLRVFNRAQKVVTGKEVKGGEGWERPSLLPRSSSGMGMTGGMAGGNVPAQGLVRRPAGGDVLFDYKEK